MIIQTIIDTVLNTADWGAIFDSILGSIVDEDCVSAEGSTCPGSAFNFITAAFATQGYWAQADILDYLTLSSFGHIAPLVYVLASIAGIFGAAFGAPPKMWLWFLIGPGIYYWMVAYAPENTSVDGVRVMFGARNSDFYDAQMAGFAQKRVWDLSRVGLQQMGIFERYGCGFDDDTGAPSFCSGGERNKGEGAVQPAYLFLVLDSYLSYIIEYLVEWTGVYNSIDDGTVGGSDTPKMTPEFLISNLKWGVLEDITSAKLASADMRDLFVTFLASECGAKFSESISNGNYVVASSSSGASSVNSIFPDNENYGILKQNLESTSIPIPKSMKRMIEDSAPGSYSKVFPEYAQKISDLTTDDFIKCFDLFQVVVYGFRWEAGNAYYQMLTDTPPGVDPNLFLKNMVRGWWILEDLEGTFSGNFSSSSPDKVPMTEIENDTLQQFFVNLIMVHMVRNEFLIAPQPVTKIGSGNQDALNYAEAYQKTVGQKTKFTELYTWALMTPNLQGVLLYLLAIAYPFVCIFMMIPGWHKIFITWTTFWIWAKLWDLGFAVVTVLEKSVWSVIGNNNDTIQHFSRVVAMNNFGLVSVNCADGTNPMESGFCPASAPAPLVTLQDATGSAIDFISQSSWVDAASLFDRAMTIGLSVSLDLSNSYYIYIMAALYMAVPAVTGQLVLGSKASAAGIATQAFGGMAGEAGKASGSGFSGNLSKQTEANAATAKQTFQAKAMRSGAGKDAVSQALGLGNNALKGELRSQGYGDFSTATGRRSRQFAFGLEDFNQNNDYAFGTMSSAIGAQKAEIGLRTGTQSQIRVGAGQVESIAGRSQGQVDQRRRHDPPSQSRPQTTSSRTSPTGDDPEANKHTTPNNIRNVAGSVPGLVGAGAEYNSIALNKQGSALDGYAQVLSQAQRSGSLYMSRQNRNMQAGTEAAQNEALLKGSLNNMYTKADSVQAGIQEQLAEQLSQEQTWEGMRDYANQTSGTLAAMGVSSAIAPGAKPAIMKGMAADGMLDANGSRKNKNYMDFTKGGASSQFGQMATKQFTDLNNEFGYDAMMNTYATYSPQYAKQFSFDRFNANAAADPNGAGLVKQFQGGFESELKSFDGAPIFGSPLTSENKDPKTYGSFHTVTDSAGQHGSRIVQSANYTTAEYVTEGRTGPTIDTAGPSTAPVSRREDPSSKTQGAAREQKGNADFKRIGDFKF